MKTAKRNAAAALALVASVTTLAGAAFADVTGWLNWRGPEQTGVSRETGLPDKWSLGGANHRWTLDIAGGGTPVIANGRVYALGYQGQGPDLQEVLICADAETGRKLWDDANQTTPRGRNPQASLVWLGDTDRAIRTRSHPVE